MASVDVIARLDMALKKSQKSLKKWTKEKWGKCGIL